MDSPSISLQDLVLLAVTTLFCASECPAANFSGVAWPEGDRLFHQDPRWLGADGAYSVDLGNQRVLWLFADSFVAKSAARTRRESAMVRNSLGIEEGHDPSRDRMTFYWGGTPSSPASFFLEHDGVWYWPGDGVRIGQSLVLFLMRVEATREPGAFGFKETGWEAIVVTNPDEEPTHWKILHPSCPQKPFGIIVGSGGVLVREGFLYAFGNHEPAAHDVHLVRWPALRAASGDFGSPQWWDPDHMAWVPQTALHSCPRAVLLDGTTEFTVHYDQGRRTFIEFQTVGFGAATIQKREAPALTGPWGPLTSGYRPPEADIPGVFNYAGKAHPELMAPGADLVLSYATNTTDFARQVNDNSLYYPRLVKARWLGP